MQSKTRPAIPKDCRPRSFIRRWIHLLQCSSAKKLSVADNAHARLDETTMLFAVSMALCTQPDYRVAAVEKGREAGRAELTLSPAQSNPDTPYWRFEFEKSEGTFGAVKARRIP